MRLIATTLFVFTLIFLPAFADSRGDAKKGKEIFESRTCVECHKDGGNTVKPSKPLKGEAFAKKYKDNRKIVKIIRQGAPGAGMPAFGVDVITDEQMKDLVAYIRSLTPHEQKKQGKKTDN